MKKITKKTLKRIKNGFHDDLMDAIEFLIDTYDEDKFDAGYRSCMEDLSVRSYRLAEYIGKMFASEKIPIVYKPTGSRVVFDTDDLARVIEDYYTDALKQ